MTQGAVKTWIRAPLGSRWQFLPFIERETVMIQFRLILVLAALSVAAPVVCAAEPSPPSKWAVVKPPAELKLLG